MKKKLLVVFCLMVTLIFSACGSSDESHPGVAEPVINTPIPTAQPIEEEPVFEPEGQTLADEFVEATEEPEPIVEPEPERTDGIYLSTIGTEGKMTVVKVYRIDPDIAEIELVRTISWKIIQDGIQYAINDNSNRGYHTLSYDHSKVAVTMIDSNRMETHTGWIDENGEFFDVTEALDWQYHGGFSEEKNGYQTEGFLPGSNELIFRGNYVNYYGVPDNNVTPEAVITYGQEMKQPYIKGRSIFITDKINANLYLVECDIPVDFTIPRRDLAIYDITTGEFSIFLPENTRYNYDGTISPDGVMVAFFSDATSSANGGEGGDIYIVPLSGGEPQLLIEASEFMTNDVAYAQLINWQ